MARDRLAAMRVSPLLMNCTIFQLGYIGRPNNRAVISEVAFTVDPLPLSDSQFTSDNPSYSSPGTGNDASGYQSRRPNPYAQQDDRYEMTDVGQGRNSSSVPLTSGVDGDDMSSFYSEVDRLSQPHGEVLTFCLDQLHTRQSEDFQ